MLFVAPPQKVETHLTLAGTCRVPGCLEERMSTGCLCHIHDDELLSEEKVHLANLEIYLAAGYPVAGRFYRSVRESITRYLQHTWADRFYRSYYEISGKAEMHFT